METSLDPRNGPLTPPAPPPVISVVVGAAVGALGDYFYGHDPGARGHLERFSIPALAVRLRLADQLGLLIPDPVLEEDDLEDNAYVIKVRGIEAARGRVDIAVAVPTAKGKECKALRAGEVIAAHLYEVLCHRPQDIITLEYVDSLLQIRDLAEYRPPQFRPVLEFATRCPDLVAEVHHRHSLVTIRDVLRGLAAENFPLTDLESIFRVLARRAAPVVDLLPACREVLRPACTRD